MEIFFDTWCKDFHVDMFKDKDFQIDMFGYFNGDFIEDIRDIKKKILFYGDIVPKNDSRIIRSWIAH